MTRSANPDCIRATFGLAVDKGLLGVYVHFDAHDPTASPSSMIRHWYYEVGERDSVYRNTKSDWK